MNTCKNYNLFKINYIISAVRAQITNNFNSSVFYLPFMLILFSVRQPKVSLTEIYHSSLPMNIYYLIRNNVAQMPKKIICDLSNIYLNHEKIYSFNLNMIMH